jgi:GNAT superfamily N-acetyltransferase
MELAFSIAGMEDAAELAALQQAAADELTRRFGQGAWSRSSSEREIVASMRMPGFSKKLIARSGGQIAGTLRLATKKPWAIDASYFTLVARPLYLVGMAVHPRHQGKGVGRALMEQAVMMARAWPGDAIRLDAWDATAGASGFYEKCGFRMAGHAKYKGAPLVYYEMLISRPTNPR